MNIVSKKDVKPCILETSMTIGSVPNSKKLLAVRLFTVVALAGGLFHWTVIGLGVAPDNPLNRHRAQWVKMYYEDFFFQQWRLFGPDPSRFSKKLFIRCQWSNGEWSSWTDQMKNLLDKHYTYRASYHGRSVRIPIYYATTLGNLRLRHEMNCEDRLCIEAARRRSLESRLYQTALKYVERQCVRTYGETPVAVQIQIAAVMHTSSERPNSEVRRMFYPKTVLRGEK